jgi:hypothetical protein
MFVVIDFEATALNGLLSGIARSLTTWLLEQLSWPNQQHLRQHCRDWFRDPV